VNAYLRAIAGQDFTAKDFRTWAGTVLAAKALAGAERARSKTHAKREIVRAIESVAKCLGNTKAVCRKCYIHPAILDAYAEGVTIRTVGARAIRTMRAAGLDDAEVASAALLAARLGGKRRAPSIARPAA
jgi:DNA topoisomerase I